MFRALNGVMAALFALSAAVQYNDPDPLRWIAVYAIAAFLSARVALGRRVYLPGAIALGLVSAAWAVTLALGADGIPGVEELFEFHTMRTSVVEVARETLGLLMIAFWMLGQVLARLRARDAR